VVEPPTSWDWKHEAPVFPAPGFLLAPLVGEEVILFLGACLSPCSCGGATRFFGVEEEAPVITTHGFLPSPLVGEEEGARQAHRF